MNRKYLIKKVAFLIAISLFSINSIYPQENIAINIDAQNELSGLQKADLAGLEIFILSDAF